MAALLALASAVVWGAADFGGGLASRRFPAIAVVGWSQLGGLLALGAVALVTDAGNAPTGWLLWSLGAGVAGALGLWSFYEALAIGTMGVVSPITALGSVVPVVAGLMAGERPSTMQAAGIFMALGGAVAASGPELSGKALSGTSGRRSVAAATAAGVLFGLVLVAIHGGARYSPLMTLVGMRVVSVAGFGVAAVAMRTTGGVRASALPGIGAIGVADASANLTFGFASTMGMVSVVSVLAGLYPVTTVLLALVVLRERLLPVQAVGITTALVGVALLAAG